MTTVANGFFYGSGSSQQTAAVLYSEGSDIVVRFEREVLQQLPASQCQLSEPIGGLPYHVRFPDGSGFESLEHAAIEALFQGHQRGQFLHRVEKSLKLVVLAVLLLPVIVLAFLQYGSPLIARQLAPAIPETLLLQLDEQLLEGFDEEVFQPSEASESARALLLSAWHRLPGREELTLVERKGGYIGANAFALPGGHIVVTDELVELLQDEYQVLAVLAHEAGHVSEYHGLRNMIQSLAAAALLATIVGDVSWLAESLLVGGPVLVQQMAYSREFEAEADQHAGEILDSLGIPSSCLGAGLSKLLSVHMTVGEQEMTQNGDDEKPGEMAASTEETPEQGWWQRLKSILGFEEEIEIDWSQLAEYLSTHPDTALRIQRAGGTHCQL